MTRVLFVPPNSREVAQLMLVKPELEQMGGEVASIAVNRKMQTILAQAGLSFKRFEDYETMNMLDIIDREQPDLLLTNPIGSFPVLDALTVAANYRGIPCVEIYNGMVISSKAVLKGVPFWKPLQSLMLSVLHTVTNTGHIRSLLCLLITLKATNGPLPFLKILPNEMFRITFYIGRSFRYREGASMVVHSHLAREEFLGLGWPPDKVFVAGQPRLDTIFRKDFNRDEFLSSLGISRDKRMALLATQPLFDFWDSKDHEEFIRNIVTAMDKFPGAELVIKIHPEERIEDYRRILKGIGRDNIRLYKDLGIYDLLNACDLLMTTHSTTALEAMILNKPVLCVDFTRRCPIRLYTDGGAALGVQRNEDLVPAIEKALYDSHIRTELELARKDFLEKNIYKPDGHTSKRVAELIVRLAQESKACRKDEPGAPKKVGV